jgi:hypothetical protein
MAHAGMPNRGGLARDEQLLFYAALALLVGAIGYFVYGIVA